MKETLTAFLARRRLELQEEEATLRQRLQEIAIERAGLDRAESAISPKCDNILDVIDKRISFIRRIKSIKPGTIMSDVISILEDNPDGLTAQQILFVINVRRESDFLERTSLSPQLSRLKQAGYIELDGSIWRLARPWEPKEDAMK